MTLKKKIFKLFERCRLEGFEANTSYAAVSVCRSKQCVDRIAKLTS